VTFDYFAFFLASGPDAVKLPLAMLVVFASAKILDELFERFNQPGIVGQILAGVMIGPGVLGWMAPNDFLTALAELGVMFLLFRVGLEVKASDLIRVGAMAAWVAVLGVAFPFVLGWGLLRLWGEPQIESIFVGAAMVATSVGITAQVLAYKGLLQERASQIILAAAVIDDVLGLLILALVSSLAKAAVNVLELALTATLAIGFTMIVIKWGAKTMQRLVPRVHGRLRGGEAQFGMAMILLFGLSVLAVYAGVAAIIGAFLAGMVLAESVGHRVHDLAQGVTELLVPFFLAGIGLHLSLSAVSNWSTVTMAGIVLLAAILSKFIGCGLVNELVIDARREAWLFPSEAGNTPLSYSNVYRRRIQPVLATVGLGDVNFQVLRRTWATEFRVVEKDPVIRAQLADHSVDVHENEYHQVQPAVLKRAM
jgi:Kef-type K+ transport system membrane component KefB